MSRAHRQAVARAAPSTLEAAVGYSDDTGPRIWAYLASMTPHAGVAGILSDAGYKRGRALINRLAVTAQGEDSPRLRLSASDCADILRFMSFSEPTSPRTWWKDPADAPSHVVGFNMVLNAMEDSLRQLK